MLKLAAPAEVRSSAHTSALARHIDRVFRQLVDGQLVAGERLIDVIDPATEQPVARAAVASKEQVDHAVSAASRAFGAWSSTPWSQRAAVIDALADALAENGDEMAELITLETGKPLAMAKELEVEAGITWLRYFATLTLEPEVLRDDVDRLVERRRVPLGVVAVIVPWNFPLFQTLYKLAPALLAGNTVVLKPAPTTPLHALRLGEIIRDLVPPGVVNVLGDDGSVGPQLSAHPDIGHISFTGSTEVGKGVMRNAASTIKGLVLELGGNDAAVVMPDADVTDVAPKIFELAFAYSGQICVGIKRIFVPTSSYETFCEQFAQLAERAVLGHGLEPATTMGPLQNAKQFETVKDYLVTARQDGTIISGGSVEPGPGFFVRPTVVRDIDPRSSLVTEETFGPVRCVMRYDDLDEVVGLVNHSVYGLGSSVWGTDLDAATAVARRLQSGTVWVNTHLALSPDVPYGGLKQSGVGVEYAMEGLLEFVEPQVIWVARR